MNNCYKVVTKSYYKNYYYYRQSELRDEAVDWQLSFNDNSYSWLELSEWWNYFYKYGKRFGLINEFKENGIL